MPNVGEWFRGTSAGLRAIERKTLQENGQLVAKPAPTQP